MNHVLVHVRFPYAGPMGEAMSQAYGALADDIAGEPGLCWKLWLEEPALRQAGGAYLFEDRASAERYLAKHRGRLAEWGITAVEATIAEVNAPLSHRSRAADRPALPPPRVRPAFTTWAEVAIDRFDRFLATFSTAGRDARRRHGSLGAQVFRVPGDDHAARVLIDWRDRAAFEGFGADPAVRETMRAGGALRPPAFTVLDRADRFDA